MRPDGLACLAGERGSVMDEYDIKIDAAGHDLLSRQVSDVLIGDCRAGLYGYGHFGIPCATFSPILALQRRRLRLRRIPLGRPGLAPDDRREVDDANRLVRVSTTAARAIFDTGGEFTLENVADRGDPTSPAWWAARASMCPLAFLPDMVALIAYCSLEQFTIVLCSYHDGVGPIPPQKWITIFATPGAASMLRPRLARRRHCPHPPGSHAPAVGRDDGGASRAAQTASYPRGLNADFAEVAAAYASSGVASVAEAPPGAQIVCGPALHPAAQAAVDEARRRPPRFADLAHLRSMPLEERHLAPFPAMAVDREWSEERPDDTWAVTILDEPDDERPSSFGPGLLRPIRAHHGIPGLPPGRVTYEMIFRVVAEDGGARTGLEMIRRWTAGAGAAALDLEGGGAGEGPEAIVVPADLKEPWARFVLLDTRDPTDVVRMRRSTRHTIFAGPLQIDREALRACCDEMGWGEIDPDIIGQTAEGGVETRSFCARHSVLKWHHRRLRENFELAHQSASDAYDKGWLIGPFSWPPTEPCRCIPGGIAITRKSSVDSDGVLSTVMKARVTADESYGGDDSVNAAVLRKDRATSLPSHQTHARAAGVIDAAFRRGGSRAGEFCIDLSSAFSFLLLQRADWWQQARFFVIRAAGGPPRVGFFLEPRVHFGGAWGPNRFTRSVRPILARIGARQAAFDAEQPYPSGVAAVQRERAALQRAGGLPEGAEQLLLSALQAFIDDLSGSAGADPVRMPACAAAALVSEIQARTLATGGRPAAANARVMAHCCISIHGVEECGFVHALDKAQCGDGIIVLGLRCDMERDRSDCPPAKAVVIIAEANEASKAIRSGASVPRDLVERVVGRVCNISQICPALVEHLHSGYAVASAHSRVERGGHRAPLARVRVRADSAVGVGFLALLDGVVAALESGASVPLLFAPLFASTSDAGVLTITSDASGDDGVGGFAFVAGRPTEVWVVAGAWPADVRAALAYAAMPHSAKMAAGPQPSLAMPAGELFGPFAVAMGVQEMGVSFESVISILDCKPAAEVLSSVRSRSAIMREVLALARGVSDSWLGAQLMRRFNTDADLLSHPPSVESVKAAARAAGLTVHGCDVPELAWSALRGAIRSVFDARSTLRE